MAQTALFKKHKPVNSNHSQATCAVVLLLLLPTTCSFQIPIPKYFYEINIYLHVVLSAKLFKFNLAFIPFVSPSVVGQCMAKQMFNSWRRDEETVLEQRYLSK